MNNLKLSSEVLLNLELQSKEETLLFSAFDMERNRLFFASAANRIYTTQLSSFHNERASIKTILLSDFDDIDMEPGDFITAFDYLMEKEGLIVGTSSGHLLLHSVDTNATELVGRVEGGVRCISPSPDGDLLSVTTGFGQILVMTHDWDLLYENPMEELSEGFDVREPEFSSSFSFEWPISWRGDGKYFASLSVVGDSTNLHKRLKVWERDSGTLQASSESKAFMAGVLEWMPSGAKIAAVYDRKLENKCPCIVLYERNGLERSSFDINEQIDSTVKLLKWNCSSDLLAAIVRCGNYDSIKLWFFSNNHWYLKYEIRKSRQDGMKLMWHPAKPLKIICWSLDGHITTYNFIWTTAVKENSTALVIDGSKILVTPLSLSLIPPRIYLFSLKFPTTIREIAFYTKSCKNFLAAYLSDGCLCVMDLPAPDMCEKLEGTEFVVEACILEMAFGSIIHLIWLDSHVLLSVSHIGSRYGKSFHRGLSNEDSLLGFHLQEIELACSEDQIPGLLTCSGWHAKLSCQISLEELVIGLAPNYSKKCSAFLQFGGGKIIEYISKMGMTRGAFTHDDASFPLSCPWMSVVLAGTGGSLKPLHFGLNDVGRLHVSGKTVCNNCSSFSFYSKSADQVMSHLILATKHDLLFIVDINGILLGELESKYDNFIPVGKRRKGEENISYINMGKRGQSYWCSPWR